MTAKKAGTTTVRCKMPNGTQATCNVTVKPLATSLKLNASEIVLYIGQSFDINSSVPKVQRHITDFIHQAIQK